MTGRAARAAWLALWVLALAGPAPAPAAEGDPSQPGAYCRLPAPGEEPECLEPAQARYREFFEAVERGEAPGDDLARRIARDLQAEGEESYLALNSLAYGYWRLALRAAEAQAVSAEVAGRLEGWNQLLSEAYVDHPEDEDFREALRTAAGELESRTGSQLFRPAEGLLARLERVDEQLSVRGAVKRVLHGMMDEGEAPATPDQAQDAGAPASE